jgi:hypothetical protein
MFDAQSQFVNILDRRDGGDLGPTAEYFEQYADVSAGEVVRFPLDEETAQRIAEHIYSAVNYDKAESAVRAAMVYVRPLLQPGAVVDWQRMAQLLSERIQEVGTRDVSVGEQNANLQDILARLEGEARGDMVFGPGEQNPYPKVHICRVKMSRPGEALKPLQIEEGADSALLVLQPDYEYVCGADEGPWISVPRFLHHVETGEGLPPFTRLCLDCADAVNSAIQAPVVGSVGVYVGPAGSGLRQRATLALLAMAFKSQEGLILHSDYWTAAGQHVVILAKPESVKGTGAVGYIIGHLTVGHEVEVVFSGEDFYPGADGRDNPLGRRAAAELLVYFDHVPEAHTHEDLTERQRAYFGLSESVYPTTGATGKEYEYVAPLRESLLFTDQNGEAVPEDLVTIPDPEDDLWPPSEAVRKAIFDAPWYRIGEDLYVSKALLPERAEESVILFGPGEIGSDIEGDGIEFVGNWPKFYDEDEGFTYKADF